MIKKPKHQVHTPILKFLCAFTCFTVINSGVQANPSGESVVAGNATFDRTGNSLQITTGNRTIINWQQFSIASGEQTKFIQPSASSAALNRVVGGNLSAIYGSLQSNGQIYLINPNGVLIGPNGTVNTAGFLASTLNTTNAEFLKGDDLKFVGDSSATVANRGTINAVGGDVFLIGRQVENSGAIAAPKGTIGLAAGQEVLLKQKGDERIFVKPALSGSGNGTGIANSGRVDAIQAELKASGNIYALAINNTGTIRATGAVQRGGRVLLVGNGGKINNSGRILAKSANGSGGTVKVDAGVGGELVTSGLVDASAVAPGKTGGLVQLLGDNVGLIDFAKIDVSGDAGGGTALIGGDLHGSNPLVRDALQVFMGSNATVEAGAITRGNGGSVVLWSNNATRYYGTIHAQGGLSGGNGGNVEVSSKGNLAFQGRVDLAAPKGNAGSLLLDPYDITITTDNPAPNDNAVVPQLSGADGVIFTDGTGGGTENFTIGKLALEAITGSVVLQAQHDIFVEADLNLINLTSNQSTPHRFVLQAGNNITVDQSITTGGGDIYLEANTPWWSGGSEHTPTPSDGNGLLTINAPISTSKGGYIQLTAAAFEINSTVNSGNNRSVRISTAENDPSSVQPIYIGTATGAGVALSGSAIDMLLSTYQVWVGRAWTSGSDGMGGAFGHGDVENIASELIINLPTVLHTRSAVLFYSQGDITLSKPLTTIGATSFNGALVFSGSTASINNTSGGITIGSNDPAFTGIGLGDTPVTDGINISAAQLQNIKASTLTLYAGGNNSNIVVDNITATNSANIGSVFLQTGAASGDTGTVSFLNHASLFKTLSIQSAGGVTIGAALRTITGGLTINADRFGAGIGKFSNTADITLGVNQSVVIEAASLSIGGKISSITGSLGTVTLQPSTTTQTIQVGGTTAASTDFSIFKSDLDNASNNGAVAFTSLLIGRLNGLNEINFETDTPVAYYKPVTIRGSILNGSIGTATARVGVPVTLLNTNPMTLNASIYTNGTKITVQGPAKLGGDIAFDTSSSGSGDMILFNSPLNNTTGSANSLTLQSGTGGNIKFVGAVGTTTALGSLNVEGKNLTFTTTSVANDLSVTAHGTLLQNGIFTVGTAGTPGSSSFVTTTSNYALTLSKTNHLYGPVYLATAGNGSVTLVNYNATTFAPTTSINGNLTVTSIGAINQTGGMTIGGLATFKCVNYDLDLEGSTNNFGSVSVTGKNVTLVEQSATQLAASSVTGALDLSSGGAISQNSGTILNVTGNATFRTASSINLPTAKNHLVGVLSFPGLGGANSGDVTVFNNTSTKLAGNTINGNLTLTATGNITQNDVLNVTGTFAARASGLITLSNTNNSFTTLGNIVHGNTLTLIDGNGGLTLAGAISGSVTTDVTVITSGGDLVINMAGGAGANAVTGRHINLATDSIFKNLSSSKLNTLQANGAYGWWHIYFNSLNDTTPYLGGLVAAHNVPNTPFTIPLTQPNPPVNVNAFLYANP